jgi:hypothetical protein
MLLSSNANAGWIINYCDIKDLSIEKFKCRIEGASKHSIGSLTIEELCLFGHDIHGVYFFFNDKQLMYVGMSSSRSFIERIPSHFDRRQNGWFNTLARKVFEKQLDAICNDSNATPPSFDEAVKTALGYSLVTLCIENRGDIPMIERMFRTLLEPRLNSRKKRKKNEFEYASRLNIGELIVQALDIAESQMRSENSRLHR